VSRPVPDPPVDREATETAAPAGRGTVAARPLGNRVALVARAGWGLGCLAVPAAVGGALGLRPGDRRAHLVLRLLGARDLGQAVLAGAGAPPPLLRLGTAVDALHALSMYALAAASRTYRRPALTAGAVATTWTVTTGR